MQAGPVGPLSLGEHLAWFLVLSLVVFLVYHGLHEESVPQAARRGVRRWLSFLGGSAILAAVSLLLAHLLGQAI
ncbi:MAG: hypothetical protein FJ296_08385 [Planctomycetes bacterium]|nr:hypothetical protein [Planctomycetota bacterium]